MAKQLRSNGVARVSRRRIYHILIALLGISIFLWLYLGTSLFRIYEYTLSGVDPDRASRLEETFRSFEHEPVLGFLPGNTTITFHRKAMARVIREQLPNVENAVVVVSGIHTISVEVSSHKAVFKKSDIEGITKDGYVYTEINDIRALPTLLVASSSYLESTLLSTLLAIYPKVDTAIFPVKTIYVDENRDIHIKGGDSMSEVIVDGNADVDKTWSTMVSAIDTEPLKSMLRNQKESLQYLDTRFGNKVFYKFTNGDTSSIIDEQYATTTEPTSTSSSR